MQKTNNNNPYAKLFNAAAIGDRSTVEIYIKSNPSLVHLRDENDDMVIHLAATVGFYFYFELTLFSTTILI